MDISAALSAATQALSILRHIRDIDKNVSDAEFKIQIAELTSLIADIKGELTDAKSALAEKNTEIAQLTEKLKWRVERTIRFDGFTFEFDEYGLAIGGPFCTVCEQEGVLIRLTGGPKRSDVCPRCKATFDGHPGYVPQELVDEKLASNS